MEEPPRFAGISGEWSDEVRGFLDPSPPSFDSASDAFDLLTESLNLVIGLSFENWLVMLKNCFEGPPLATASLK